MTSTNKQPTFVRNATGLVRAFSATDALLFNLYLSAIGVTIAVLPGIFASLFPNADPLTAVLLGALFAISSGWVPMALSVAMPRSGGDYVFNTRLITPSIGFMMSFTLIVVQVLDMGLFGSWISNFGLSGALLSYGAVTGSHAALSWGSLVATPIWTFGISGVAIVLIGAIMWLGPRAAGIFMKILAIPALLSLIVLFVILATNTHVSFVNAFNHFAGTYTGQTDSYSYFLQVAHSAGYTTPAVNPLSTLYAAIFSSVVLYIGFQQAFYVGGEIKKAERSIPLGILGALLATLVALAVATYLWYDKVVGTDITNALTYVSANSPSNYTLPTSVSYNLFAGIMTTSLPLIIILSVGFFAWFLMLVFTGWMLNTRVQFGWSFDRVTPSFFSKVNSRGAPTILIVFTAALGLIMLYIISTVFNLTFLLNTTLLNSTIFIVMGISAILLPLRRKALFDSSPRIVRAKLCPDRLPAQHLGCFDSSVAKYYLVSVGIEWRSAYLYRRELTMLV